MFFAYRQNNSGGFYEGLAKYVIIEAGDADDANEIAINKADIYFDGVDEDRDCECCGDRWLRCRDSNGEESLCDPRCYEDRPLNVENFHPWPYKDCEIPTMVIYYENGEVVTLGPWKGITS